jgi:hypothetical protein
MLFSVDLLEGVVINISGLFLGNGIDFPLSLLLAWSRGARSTGGRCG